MIQKLTIKNFILINEVSLDFRPGFSVFTGETGAGKSILIDAIGILLGDRFLSESVGKESSKSSIEGVFSIDREAISTWLNENGIDAQHGITISREVDKDGKSSSRLNGKSISVGLLKELGNMMIDIHNQHDTQYLLNTKYHLGLLDRFVNEKNLLGDVKSAYQKYDSIRKDILNKKASSLNVDDLEFLSFQINEIEASNLIEGEDLDLEQKHKEMMAFEKIATHLGSALTLLDETDGVSEKLYEAIRELRIITESERIIETTNSINSLYYELTDKIADLNQSKSLLNFDEENVNAIQERLFLISKLKKKYGHTISDIQSKKHELEDRVALINNRESILAALMVQEKEAYEIYKQLADQISTIRKAKALELESLVLSECRDLYLDKAQFRIVFSEGSDTNTGYDEVEFLISMNPGEMLKPLVKVASGGELSRLMLGLKVIFNALQQIETVIFDEIDSGVSGRVATAIGQKMHKIAKNSQVFSVTHLGQVAACANQHYLVSKAQNDSSTSTFISQLNYDQRIDELSLISTGTSSDHSKNAAKELLDTLQAQVNAQ
ncbi:MAG: DNA repair protein RecN [Erysipelotrichaceae bacterium]|nr:DNA repair protein RecN [Erysipelotrichaceae bacterium]